MKTGTRVAISLPNSGDVGHSVVMNHVVQKTVNGEFVKNIFYIMNPGSGNIERLATKSIINAPQIFYIIR
jgi:hypothetical protein